MPAFFFEKTNGSQKPRGQIAKVLSELCILIEFYSCCEGNFLKTYPSLLVNPSRMSAVGIQSLQTVIWDSKIFNRSRDQIKAFLFFKKGNRCFLFLLDKVAVSFWKKCEYSWAFLPHLLLTPKLSHPLGKLVWWSTRLSSPLLISGQFPINLKPLKPTRQLCQGKKLCKMVLFYRT